VTPEFILGLALLVIGTVAVAFPREKDYLTRLINLEIPGFGLLLVMLSYDEALALFTFAGVSVITTFVFVRVIEKKEAP
jgi:energy-converting hydrogenase A subunit E